MRPARTLFLALGALLIVSGSAAAQQFRTPDRQFHNQTSFPLDGRHRAVECESCHIQGQYKGTPVRCFDCHWVRRQDDRNRLQLGTMCEQCHRPSGWANVKWDHGAMTSMPLNGAHRQISCASCHRDNTFTKIDMSCVSCHERDYQATTSPNHVAAGYSRNCEMCHRASDTSFRAGAGVNHAAFFPLVGQHAQLSCATCHVNNVFKGTSRDCIGCHRDDYNRTTSPNHAASGFSTSCEGCHRASDPSFRGSAFNHAAIFPLVGQHAQLSCAACHVNNVFKGTSRDCVGCHRDDYNRTSSPSHAATGFPTTCESCHRAADSSWAQGTFNHRFPITSGRHRADCATCHTSSNFQSFTCLTCHEHSQARMDSEHRGRNGYRYDSLACYGCHPTGRGD